MNFKNLLSRTILALLALCLLGCGTEAGKGRHASAGYRAAAPVIASLEKYHEAHGRYPASLIELVPKYLPNTNALLISGGIEPTLSPRSNTEDDSFKSRPFDSFWYTPQSDSYILIFRFAGPGMNQCTYDSKTKKWSAQGHY